MAKVCVMKFAFHIEWEDPAEARGDDLRATWARLSLSINGKSVFDVLDRNSGSERDAIYGPALPIAQWLAENWFFLLNEVGHRQDGSPDYWRRHNLQFASEGFALPSMRIMPLGDIAQVSWRPTAHKHSKVRFLGHGNEIVPVCDVRDGIAKFLNSVCLRLEDQGIADHPLVDEWNAIQSLDDEEVEFSRAASRAGIDPFAISKSDSDAILNAYNSLPRKMFEDFITVTSFANLRDRAEWASQSLRQLAGLASALDYNKLYVGNAARRTNRVPNFTSTNPPHIYGRKVARRIRSALLDHVDPISGVEELLIAFGAEQPGEVLLIDPDIHNPVHALHLNDEGLRILVTREREDSQRFAICRTIFNHLHSDGRSADLVADSYLAKDKASRAFAAEFLAPHQGLKGRVREDVVSVDELSQLASEYQVSSQVIEHQLENHNIARVSRTW